MQLKPCDLAYLAISGFPEKNLQRLSLAVGVVGRVLMGLIKNGHPTSYTETCPGQSSGSTYLQQVFFIGCTAGFLFGCFIL